METPYGSSEDTFASVYRRAELLQEQGRHADAAEWFQKAIAIDPEHDAAHARLALAWLHHESTYTKAVAAARRAVSLDPENSFNHGVLAAALIDTAKPGQHKPCAEGLVCADKSVELDPDSSFAHSVRAVALLRCGKAVESEKAARRALELHPDNTMAALALTNALTRLGKKEDLKSLVDWQLQEHPDDDSAHVSAGYQALHDGRVKEANTHFREALRIDPGNESARQGLIESFRARSFIYRWYLQFAQFMRVVAGDKTQIVLLIGYVIYRIGREALKKTHPGLAALLGAVWLTFALWTFFARGLGSMLMLTDPFARMAIRPREKWEGILVGGFVTAALVMLAGGVALGSKDAMYASAVLVFAGVPIACAFSNDHYRWGKVFTAAGAIAGLCALLYASAFLIGFSHEAVEIAGLTTILIGVASTWLGVFSGFGR